MLRSRALPASKINLLTYLGLFTLMLWSVYFFINEDLIAKSYNFKYWFFYIGLLLCINRFFKEQIRKFWSLCDYLISLSWFVCFFGILQFCTNLAFLPNYQLDYFNLRPSGFFSETTWYSEYIFYGLLLVVLTVLKHKNKRGYLYSIPLFLIGFLLSVTRNTFVAVFLYLVLTYIASVFIERRFYMKIVSSKMSKFVFLLVIIGTFVSLTQLSEVIDYFAYKFSGSDGSAQGRIEAYKLSWELIKTGKVWGNGFYWDFSQSTVSGSALGAKSFNLFLMIAYIFGIPGFLVFLIIITSYILKMCSFYIITKSIYIRYAIIVIICFLQMSMFAPLHQYPFGMLVVSISSLLFYRGIHIENCNSSGIYQPCQNLQ